VREEREVCRWRRGGGAIQYMYIETSSIGRVLELIAHVDHYYML
jgi:hypothetical protein